MFLIDIESNDNQKKICFQNIFKVDENIDFYRLNLNVQHSHAFVFKLKNSAYQIINTYVLNIEQLIHD